MPKIYLNHKEGDYTTKDVKVTVEPYPFCKIFNRYTHKPEKADWRPGTKITLLKSNGSFKQEYSIYLGNRRYYFRSLESASVYFNRYDSKNANPLILVLLFKGSNLPQRKYLALSKFLNRSGYSIDSLDNYEDEADILPILIKENKETNKQITFKIEPPLGKSNVIKHQENIGTIFERVTFMANTSPQKISKSNGIYELYCSTLLENDKSSIDKQTVSQYNSQTFNAVCVYYHKTEKIALLIEFVANYVLKLLRRKKSNGDSKWVEDNLNIPYLCNDDLTKYLKIILFCLKNKIIIRLDKQGEYTENQVVDTVNNNDQSPEKNKKIIPTKSCTTHPKKYNGYVCYNHNLKDYYDKNLENIVGKLESSSTFNFDIYLEIVFMIFNKKISICSSSHKEYLFYKPGPGPPGDNVYVYFYEKSEQDDRPDTVPLMLEFDKNFYGPYKKEDYFKEWSKIDNSKHQLDISNPNDHIKSELDKFNKSLNQICLKKTDDYGITGLNGVTKNGESNFDPVRVRVLKNKIPAFREFDPIRSDNIHCEYSVYSKNIHSTVNTFQLGAIDYNGKNVNVKENGKQTTSGTLQVTSGQNQLTVYYLTKDQNYEYPLLIGIGKKYIIDDFYKLISKNSDYVWEKIKDEEKFPLKGGTVNPEIIKLLDKINYSLKQAAVIEIDKRSSYVLKATSITSSSESFLPINDHNVIVAQKHACEPLWEAGYRRLFHNISEIKNFDYCLIGSIKFYTHVVLSKEDSPVKKINKGIKLYKIRNSDNKIREKILTATSFVEIESYLNEYTPIYYSSCRPEVFVYFYRDDPRPGLLCFGNTTYKPIKLPQLIESEFPYTTEDYTNWVGIRRTKKCVCENEMELKFLTEVLDGLYFSSQFEKFISEYWVTLSAGAGGGVIGVGGVAGGGYLLWTYFAEVSPLHQLKFVK
ncbi:hypothetical protein TOT_010000572 [Theileria orientalis strain Shintoku]|uniref:Uncharacterized protein n=1 Tax=Theileria orientalis strain Shintoku TaxID=869250 RepID=J4D5Q1_THEOR|nr:hypothetical protein TOT_010000572 [Theileria orientalis strain Shintoku]BAM39110.1 hypothetical protein TOT_010000572 [Theileria orientalis strain Shintoku]|eukprot:XP_009689411.1 hypothetical protein TOT_010000572 [Theileria orientalis strain Shintoku]